MTPSTQNNPSSASPSGNTVDTLTPAEIQAILDNLAIDQNMNPDAQRAAQSALDTGDDLLDAMHGGAVDISASGPAPQEGSMPTREATDGGGLNVVPEIVQTRQQLLRELFPNSDASTSWESAGPEASAPESSTPESVSEAERPLPLPQPTPAPVPAPTATPAPMPWQPTPVAEDVAPALPVLPPSGTAADLPNPATDLDWTNVPPLGVTSYRVLQTEIAALYGEVRELLSPDQDASKRARTLLSEASIMLKGQPEDLTPVEAKVQEVRALLRKAQMSHRYGDAYGRRMLIYLAGWLLLSLGTIVYVYLDGSLLGSEVTQGLGRHTNALVITLFWGAIGGVLSAVHSLWWHVSEAQDYHYRFNVSYLFRPIAGMVLAGLIYALFAFAFDSLNLDLANSLLLGLVPSLIALVAGFRSGQLLRLIGLSPKAA